MAVRPRPRTAAPPRPTPPGGAVEVSGLVQRYGDVTAVAGLDLTLPAGSLLALLGPNGAGKTTTVETCEGYRRPAAGGVRVLGIDPYAGPAARRRLLPRIGVMLQRTGVAQGARPIDVLRQYASFAAQPWRPEELLDLLGVTHLARRPYRRLSGGEQQRVCLAVALVGRPELLFLDEPTAGLDPQARHAVWDLLRAMRRDGVSIMLTTHDMTEAETLADHVVIMDRGTALAAGTTQQLTEGDAGGQVRFRAPAGLPVATLRSALPGRCGVSESPAGHYVVDGGVDPQVLATVTAWCAGHGVMPEQLQVERRTLEDLFLELTGRTMRQ